MGEIPNCQHEYNERLYTSKHTNNCVLHQIVQGATIKNMKTKPITNYESMNLEVCMAKFFEDTILIF